MKPSRGLRVRVALTVLPVIALGVASTRLLLPGLDDAFVRRLQEQSPFAFAAHVSVLAIGVMPFVQAFPVVTATLVGGACVSMLVADLAASPSTELPYTPRLSTCPT